MRTFILAIVICTAGTANTQQNELNKIKEFDLSNIWTSNGSTDIDEADFFTTKRPDFLGFIGDDYQRIYIRIEEVVKNSLNPLMYYFRGNSDVMCNRCTFLGTIKIDSVHIRAREPIFEGADYLVDMEKVTHVGLVVCSYEFFENRNQRQAGYFSGQLQTRFYLTIENQIKYDAIGGFSDSCINNAYVGTWTSYVSEDSKTCNWGEFRILDSGDLDIGSGEFSPNPKYIDNGWKEN